MLTCAIKIAENRIKITAIFLIQDASKQFYRFNIEGQLFDKAFVK